MALLTIGQLPRRTGVPVRTIRFWSDEGVLPETERTGAGYRRYDARAVARLDFVRTLRELGVGLDDVGSGSNAAAASRTSPRRTSEPSTAGSASRTQRALCTLLARGGPTPRKVSLMNELARLSAEQRQQLIDEFVDATFAGTDPDAPGAGIAGAMRTMPAELADDPTTEQVEAWIELAELVGDPSFRDRVREMAVAGSATPAAPEAGSDQALIPVHAGAALAAGIAPDSAAAREFLDRIVPADLDPPTRAALATTIDTFTDRRVERYWQLLGILNGWAPVPSQIPPFEWTIAALRAHP